MQGKIFVLKAGKSFSDLSKLKYLESMITKVTAMKKLKED
jgi:hypothetical protein